MSTALERAAAVAALIGVDGDPIRHGDGWSNCVWLYPDAVIRVAAREGPGTLDREATVAAQIPASVGYPQILGSGRIDGHEWMAQIRLPGDNLGAVWNRLTSAERGRAVADLWARLSSLSQLDTAGLDLPPSPLYGFEPAVLSARLAEARSIAGDMITSRAADLIEQCLRSARSEPTTLVHTDAVFSNVVWTGSAAVPVDFEFATLGPADLDLDCVGREVVTRADRTAVDALRSAANHTFRRPGASVRMRGYALLISGPSGTGSGRIRRAPTPTAGHRFRTSSQTSAVPAGQTAFLPDSSQIPWPRRS